MSDGLLGTILLFGAFGMLIGVSRAISQRRQEIDAIDDEGRSGHRGQRLFGSPVLGPGRLAAILFGLLAVGITGYQWLIGNGIEVAYPILALILLAYGLKNSKSKGQ